MAEQIPSGWYKMPEMVFDGKWHHHPDMCAPEDFGKAWSERMETAAYNSEMLSLVEPMAMGILKNHKSVYEFICSDKFRDRGWEPNGPVTDYLVEHYLAVEKYGKFIPTKLGALLWARMNERG